MKPDDAAKAAAKADREAHKAEPDDPRDTGIDTDLDDPDKQENVEDDT